MYKDLFTIHNHGDSAAHLVHRVGVVGAVVGGAVGLKRQRRLRGLVAAPRTCRIVVFANPTHCCLHPDHVSPTARAPRTRLPVRNPADRDLYARIVWCMKPWGVAATCRLNVDRSASWPHHSSLARKKGCTFPSSRSAHVPTLTPHAVADGRPAAAIWHHTTAPKLSCPQPARCSQRLHAPCPSSVVSSPWEHASMSDARSSRLDCSATEHRVWTSSARPYETPDSVTWWVLVVASALRAWTRYPAGPRIAVDIGHGTCVRTLQGVVAPGGVRAGAAASFAADQALPARRARGQRDTCGVGCHRAQGRPIHDARRADVLFHPDRTVS